MPATMEPVTAALKTTMMMIGTKEAAYLVAAGGGLCVAKVSVGYFQNATLNFTDTFEQAQEKVFAAGSRFSGAFTEGAALFVESTKTVAIAVEGKVKEVTQTVFLYTLFGAAVLATIVYVGPEAVNRGGGGGGTTETSFRLGKVGVTTKRTRNRVAASAPAVKRLKK